MNPFFEEEEEKDDDDDDDEREEGGGREEVGVVQASARERGGSLNNVSILFRLSGRAFARGTLGEHLYLVFRSVSLFLYRNNPLSFKASSSSLILLVYSIKFITNLRF